MEVELLGLEPVSIEDASIIGSGLTSYATTLAPRKHILVFIMTLNSIESFVTSPVTSPSSLIEDGHLHFFYA